MAADLFYLNRVYPEPDKIFSFSYKNYSQIKDDCLFVLDTNILFVPFQASKKGLADIKIILEKLKSENRLFIPERVAREFAKNRGATLANIYKQTEQAIDKINTINIFLGNMPIFSESQSYQEAKKLEGEIRQKVNILKDKLTIIRDEVKFWNWNDPVSELYKTIFTPEILVKENTAPNILEDELKFRLEHSIAPGYKDKDKIDSGIGDLVIWFTILDLAANKNTNITFVSNEKKNDWFHGENKVNLYPKFELYDEFRRKSNGKCISLISFEEFLTSLGASSETVEEITEQINVSKQLLVKEATYGTQGRFFDMTKELNSRIQNNKLDFLLNNDIVGDPIPGIVKTLKITYMIDEKEITSEYNEGARVIIQG